VAFEYRWARNDYNRLPELAADEVGGTVEPNEPDEDEDEDEGPYVPIEWEGLSDDQQQQAEDAWMSQTYDEFYQSEVDSWQENGSAVDDATRSRA
jgi:hypothetical protein